MKTLARSACVAVLVLLAVATASPAVAKGPTDVTVSGPGVDIKLGFTQQASDVDVGTLGEAVRIWDIYGEGDPAASPDVAEDVLGPRFVITWTIDQAEIVQHAYPFAEGGAWVETLPDQKLWGTRPVPPGWTWTPALTQQLVQLGALEESQEPAIAEVEPAVGPVAATDRPERQSTASDGDGSAYAVAVPAGLALAGMLAVGALVVWRRRVSR